MSEAHAVITAAVIGIFGLAILALLFGAKGTPNMIQAAGNALTSLISKAVNMKAG